MRIVAGRWRGHRLSPLGRGDRGMALRPTSGRVRESLFNMLINGAPGVSLAGARVIDVFAGTGALGLEALSRGAAEAVFIETSAKARAVLCANLRRLGVSAPIIARDARHPGARPGAAFDVMFLDPPYGLGLGEAALDALRDWLAPQALVVWEEATHPRLPPWLVCVQTRTYGRTVLTVCRVCPEGEA